MTDGNHSYVTLEKNSPEKKSQVRSWKKTCGLGPTKEITVDKDCLRDTAPDELNGLSKITILKNNLNELRMEL